jgi:hypothetical protein
MSTAKKRIEELMSYSKYADYAKNGNQMLTNFSNSDVVKKAKMAASFSKMGAYGLGKDTIDEGLGDGMMDDIIQNSAYASLFGAGMTGQKIQKMNVDAKTRQMNAASGQSTGVRDSVAAGANAFKNVGQLGRNVFYGSAALGMDGLKDIAKGSLGMNAGGMGFTGMHAAGGMGALGSGASSLVGMLGGGTASAVGGSGLAGLMAANPAMAGMMSMMALSKGGKALFNKIQEGSSVGNGTPTRRETVSRGVQAHDLEKDYGNTLMLRMQIAKMQNGGSMTPAEAMLGNILAMIEGHTSVLPLIAAETMNTESRRNFEGGNKAHNELEDMFGADGSLSRYDQMGTIKDPGIMFKLLNGLEQGSANLNSTFDIMGQITNTLSGKSSTALYNEANDKTKLVDEMKAEKKFGEKYGVSTNMTRAIHMSPAEVMNTADTYEGKHLALLGLNTEITRFMAHELLQIRTVGFGIQSGGSTSYLEEQKELLELERLGEEDGLWKAAGKGIDEMLGYIPGWNVISGAVKMSAGAIETTNNWMDAYEAGNVRSVGGVFKDWIMGDVKNKTLESEKGLAEAIGATELGPEALMANYLGKAYPERFEVLLDYTRHIMESVAHTAGNGVRRTETDKLSMNKYTGQLGDDGYHSSVQDDQLSKMEDQLTMLNPIQSMFGQMFATKDMMKEAQEQQMKAAFENNPLIGKLMDEQDGQVSQSYSLQDQQNDLEEKERKTRTLNVNEQQLVALWEIRDILDSGGGSRGKRKKGKGSSKEDYEASILDMFGGPDLSVGHGRKGTAKRSSRRRATKSSKLLQKLEKVVGKGGFKALSKAGLVARLVGAGIGRGALALLGPVGIAIGLAWTGYELYSAFNNSDDELNKAKINSTNADKKYDLKTDVEKNRLIQKLKNHSEDSIKQLNKFFSGKTLEELLLFRSALKDQNSRWMSGDIDNSTVILNILNKHISIKEKNTPEALKKIEQKRVDDIAKAKADVKVNAAKTIGKNNGNIITNNVTAVHGSVLNTQLSNKLLAEENKHITKTVKNGSQLNAKNLDESLQKAEAEAIGESFAKSLKEALKDGKVDEKERKLLVNSLNNNTNLNMANSKNILKALDIIVAKTNDVNKQNIDVATIISQMHAKPIKQ